MSFGARFSLDGDLPERYSMVPRGLNPPCPPFSKGGDAQAIRCGYSPLCKRGGGGDSPNASRFETHAKTHAEPRSKTHAETNP